MLDLNQPGAQGRALSLANEHLSAIVAASPLAMISTDFERNVVFWNAAAERLFGWNAEEVIGKRLPFVPADREEESRDFARRVQQGERLQDIDTVRLHRNGTPIEVSISLAPVLGPDGLPSGTVGILEEVGARWQIAAALATSETRLRSLANSMAAIVCTASRADGVLDYFNDRFYEYTGMTPETRPPLPFSVAIHPDDYPRAAAEWRQAVRDGVPIESECRLRRADWQYRWQLVRATPAQGASHGAVAWVLTIIDIHELRQTQEAVSASEARWRILTDAMPAIICGAAPDGTADHFNERWFEYTGLSPAEMHDSLVPGVFHPDEREAVVAAWHRALTTGEPYDLEYRLKRADGVYRWHLSQVVPVRGADGVVTRWISTAVDIDDRKRAEEAVATSEQRWRGLMQSVPALIATTDAEGAVDFHNERWTEFTGLASAALRERWSTIVHADDLPALTANWQTAIVSRRAMTNEYRILRRDGTWLWHRSTTTPVTAADGSVQLWIDVCIDIDDQKQAADELRASEQRWRTIADTMPALVAIGGTDGGLGFFNQRFTEYTGVSHEDLAGDGWLGVVHPDDVQPGIDRWEQTRALGVPVQFEQRFRRVDGEYRTHLCIGQPVRGSDGEIAFWIGVNVDIEDRKREELKRDASDERFRLASVAARLGTWEWDGADAQEWSESLEEIYGFAPGGYPGTTAAFLDRVHPDDRERVQSVIAEAAAQGTELDLEHRIVRPDGSVRWLNCRGRQFRDASGWRVYMMGIAIDITERKHADIKLQEAAEELRRANAAKDEFLGLVSHELRTPITTIFGNAEILQKHGDRVDEASRQVALADIRNEADRLHRIIDNLLVLARLERGQQLDREPVLIDRIVERVVAEQRRQHPDRAILVAPETKLAPVLASPGYVEQVMRNLLSNAQKYGGSDSTIEVAVTREGDRIVTRVLDRGAGISQDDAERIFTPFFRAASTAFHAQGVGIGLAVCKRLIEAQSGEMSYRPRDGGGSEFAFSLPIAADTIDD